MKKEDFIIHFFNVWKKDKLPHFNIIFGPESTDQQTLILEDIIKQLLCEVLSSELLISPQEAQQIIQVGHGDILWIKKSSADNKEYRSKDKDFEEVYSFLEYRSLQLKKRFIVVPNAHKLSYLLSNKLLKTLEEPSPNTIILFLAPTNGQFIQTILSRANIWSLSSGLKNEIYKNYRHFDDFIKAPPEKGGPLHYMDKELFHHLLKTQKLGTIDHLLKAYLDFEKNNHLKAMNKSTLLDIFKTNHFEKAYHNSTNPTLAKLFHLYHGA